MESRRLKKEVRDQERPSLRRSFEFCVSSIRHRFFRSAVTLAVVVLAVAFLMNILTETIIAGAVARGVQGEFEKLYIADLFERRIARNAPLRSLVEELSTLQTGGAGGAGGPGRPRWRELERWSALPPNQFADMVQSAHDEAMYTAFFDNLDVGRRRKLVGRGEGASAFEDLYRDGNWARLEGELHSPEMASIGIPGDAPAFIAFLKKWGEYRAALNATQTGIAGVLDALTARLNGSVEKALDDPARRNELLAALQTAGFEITAGELAQICEERRRLAVLRRFREYVQDPEFRSHWVDLKIPADFTPEELLKNYLDDQHARDWLQKHAKAVAERSTDPLPVSQEELLDYSNRYRQRVQEAGKSLAHLSDGEVYKSDRQKNFIAYVAAHPQFAEAWQAAHAGQEFSQETLLWNYPDNPGVRRWLLETAKSTGEALPCAEDDVRSLADAYLKWVQKRGLQKVPVDQEAAGDAKYSALVGYLKDAEYKASWDSLGISIDFSPAAILLYCSAGDRATRVRGYVENVSRRIASRPKAPLPATDAEILDIARMERDRERVHDMQAELSARGTATDGIGERTFWLIAVSFLVCVVGIANAMLMAVTERFREIATMKCLGALDEFIMTIFLIESAMQGFIGAALGVFLGFLLAAIRCGMAFGLYTTSYFPLMDVLKNTGISTAAGMMLAILAAVYPAWVASRMAPMEAMRVE